jgi:hypothetical protein
MAKLADLARPVMGRAARFHRDRARPEFGEELQNLPALELLAQDAPAGRIGAVNLKNLLGQVQTDYANLAHGWLPSSVSYLTPFWHFDAVEGEPSTSSFVGEPASN